MESPALGKMAWFDLTVDNAEEVVDFYQSVLGWSAEPLDMGGYSDYMISAPGSQEGLTGICHRRGSNEKLPPVWLMYFTVANLTQALEACQKKGGTVIDGPREAGNCNFAIVRDPAGAFFALSEMVPDNE